jgi:fatty acid desaturase
VAVAGSSLRATALDHAIRAIPAEWFKPSRVTYWTDLSVSAAIGWTTFVRAVLARGLTRATLLAVATCALYRAVLFIHEITHLNARDVPGFRFVWNAVVGVPLLIPSFLYEGVHTDHHRQRCYGTDADPEYVAYGRQRPVVIIVSAIASLAAPLAFAVRFALLAPLSWAVPSVARATRARASALVINTRYVRHAPLDRAAHIEEAAAFLVFWTAALLVGIGRLPIALFGCWAVAMSAASFANAVRTFAAHRYDNDAGELTMVEQLLDSCTIAPRGPVRSIGDACRAIVAPVGLRYHALHHWIPSLPYHNLGRAHRRLAATLAADAPYRSTIAGGFTPVLRDLIRRSRTQSS